MSARKVAPDKGELQAALSGIGDMGMGFLCNGREFAAAAIERYVFGRHCLNGLFVNRDKGRRSGEVFVFT